MDVVITLLVLLALVLLALLLVVGMRRRNERAKLHQRFGPEYDRAVDEHGDRRAAEQQLSSIAERRDRLDIRSLDRDAHRRYSAEWSQVQTDFVDDPVGATRSADDLVGRVMRDRGYPVDDFESQADMVAVDHPHIAENYRRAHAVGGRPDDEPAATEQLRVAFLSYRSLFDELLAAPEESAAAGAEAEPEREIDLRDREQEPGTPRRT